MDVVVNNAGLGGTADLVDMTDEQWSMVLDVTLNGTFRCTRAALRHCCHGPRGDRQQRLGARLAGPSRPGPLRGGQGGGHGPDPLRRHRGGAVGVRVNAVAAEPGHHPFLAKVTSDELLAELTGRRRSAGGRAVGDRQRGGVSGQRLRPYMTGEVLSVSSQHP